MFEDLAGFQGLFAAERTQDYNKFINAGPKYPNQFASIELALLVADFGLVQETSSRGRCETRCNRSSAFHQVELTVVPSLTTERGPSRSFIVHFLVVHSHMYAY